jgi:hypothetical protein
VLDIGGEVARGDADGSLWAAAEPHACELAGSDPTPDRDRLHTEEPRRVLDTQEPILSNRAHPRILIHRCLLHNIRLLLRNSSDMLAAVPTFASLSLKRRCTAAINCIDQVALTVPQRHEIVALALWPSDLDLPGAVRRDALQAPDVDLRPARPEPRLVAQTRPIAVSTAAQRAHAREMFRRGASISEIAEEFGVSWMTARAWTRAKAV